MISLLAIVSLGLFASLTAALFMTMPELNQPAYARVQANRAARQRR